MTNVVWKRLVALFSFPALLVIAFAYWTHRSTPPLSRVALSWVLGVLIPFVGIYMLAAMRGWIGESYMRLTRGRRLICVGTAAAGLSLFALGFVAWFLVGDPSSFGIFAAGAVFLAISSFLQPSGRALSVASFVCIGVVFFVLFALR